ncbi:type II toxin-antitoxin system RelE/ParE family toxin [Pigmentiphaga aceris]|uniref:Type II toxin-antitoxin system RelE/ParE family toxin n=1 Tax=Pigmentiphaga aceris TaxID=1940612 RepID=A0A5C0AUU2_9BURK|nr:type II toxin-antitoxin system RelE/ParE family toxin [Pigmentiphaga aceris]QEI04441.1 type II toxin-antitoxin system RelE/ParE family toxin [Pigmentiphaga aceris]
MKLITFHGTSKADLRSFPSAAMREAGFQLESIQRGEEPADWKPMPSIGMGVREIRIKDDTGAYRVIYVAKFSDAVHVLHCFKKKTQKTSKADIDLAKDRLSHLVKGLRK